MQGDVAITAPAYFAKNDDVVIALAYFDMALYEPSKAALDAIKPLCSRKRSYAGRV